MQDMTSEVKNSPQIVADFVTRICEERKGVWFTFEWNLGSNFGIAEKSS